MKKLVIFDLDGTLLRGCVKKHTLFFYDNAPTFPSRGVVIT